MILPVRLVCLACEDVMMMVIEGYIAPDGSVMTADEPVVRWYHSHIIPMVLVL